MDVVIIGAGLAGLTAANLLARGGRAVTVLERAAHPGGRGATHEEAGYSLNLGPHALYNAGAARREWEKLGIPLPGKDPGVAGELLYQGTLHPLPGSPWTFLTTSLFGFSGRLQATRFMASGLLGDAHALDGTSVRDWVAGYDDPAANAWAKAMIRLFTYGNDPDHQDAGAVARQMRRGLHGVSYLDGGWGSVVTSLATEARKAGAVIRTGAHVDAVDGTRVRVDGAWETANAVIVATPLTSARSLLPELPEARPVRAACLDLGIARKERPASRFILGVDRPLYCSVHSETARLAPEGGQVVHVAHYLAPEEHADVAELEALADRAVPGWRDAVVTRRWYPSLVVASDLHTAGHARPGVRARPGVWVAGDWVGDEGMLVDASVASAAEAAADVLATLSSSLSPGGPGRGVPAGDGGA